MEGICRKDRLSWKSRRVKVSVGYHQWQEEKLSGSLYTEKMRQADGRNIGRADKWKED